jgi:eukaryotic-like serine/threonine-protein kinase
MIERIGNCRIVDEVGAGGMAVVYKAIQEPLGRVVAVKALKSSIATEAQFAERFEREARFMASLQQENIINVYDFIKLGGTMFIVMEYVEGIDLYDLLEKTPQRLSVEVATIICLQVARALNHAHFRGIIHRDIKPANVMISKRGDVKLMDFGIARDESLTDLTETGTGLGTPSYMSPEQILGDKLDQRTDIWSLGVVFYQMLTGVKPFVEDPQRSVLQKIRLDRYTPVRKLNPRIPRSIERILGRCMEKLPADRYASMQSLIHDLEDFLAMRVVINYNAYMVSYLKEQGVVSEDEAQAILATGAIRAGQKQVFRENRRSQRTSGLIFASALCAMLFGGLVIQLLYEDATPLEGRAQAALGTEEAGFLEVAADPWASVRVDGTDVDVTPFARPLSLAPGVHYVELTNPYFEPITREVKIVDGKTVRLVEKMSVEKERSPAPRGGGR